MLTKAMYDMLTIQDRQDPMVLHHMERYESKVRAIKEFASEATDGTDGAMTSARVEALLMRITGLE